MDSVKKAIVIDSFPGCGKTTLGKKRSDILDLERGPFLWIDGSYEGLTLEQRKGSGRGERNPEFPKNFLRELVAQKDNYKMILVGISAYVYHDLEFFKRFFKDNNIDFYVAMPKKKSLQNIFERYKNRGNGDDFVNFVQRIYPVCEALYESGEFGQIEIKDGEFLEDALIRKKLLSPLEKEIIKD